MYNHYDAEQYKHKPKNNQIAVVPEATEALAVVDTPVTDLVAVDEAKKEVLEVLDDSPSKQILSDIADFVLERSA